MVYQWKLPGVFPVDPQVAGEELDRIYEKYGVLEPSDVVEENRSPSAPLHHVFEWDDKVAAESYRKVQAMHVIRSVTVAPSRPEGDSVRAFVHVTTGYEPIRVVLQNPDKTRLLLAEALRQLEAFRARYKSLEEMAPVMRAIDEIL